VTTIAALYNLFLRHQVSRGRLALSLMAALCILTLALIVNQVVEPSQRVEAFVTMTGALALSLTAPILSLAFASTTFNQLVEDETLVYVWLRPTPRWHLAVASWLASLTLALPVIVIPVVIGAALSTSGDTQIMVAVGAAMSIATVAYTSLFNLMGLVLRQALLWGMVYIFIWELFVSAIGAGAADLSIRTYATTVLSHKSGVWLFFDTPHTMSTAVIVPLVVVVVSLGLTARRLQTIEVA